MVFKNFFEDAHPTVYYKTGLGIARETMLKEGLRSKGLNFGIEIIKNGKEYQPVLRWKANAPKKLHRVEFVLDREIPGNWSFFKHGYQSWTVTRSYRPGEVPRRPRRPWYMPLLDPVGAIQDNLNNLPSGKAGEYASESFTVLKNYETGDCGLAGVCGDFTDFVYFRALIDNSSIKRISVIYDYENFHLPDGSGERLLEPLYIDSGDEEALFESYLEGIKKKHSVRVPVGVPAGWCSWYYYFHKLKIDDILENLDVCRKKKLQLDYFQIDDGWQLNVGDWLEMKPDFDGKMAFLAEEIHRAGYKAGLWLAPLSATIASNIFKKNPDWFIRGGLPVITKGRACAGFNPGWNGGFFFGLDVTNPDAMEYLRTVIRTVAREWGYDVLKLDFLYSAALSGLCADNSLNRAERMKRALAAIRDESGRETFILGCGMPIMQGIGIVDGNRIGEDVSPNWVEKDEKTWGGESHVGTRNALRNTLNRAYMHRRLWLNDPDCLMIRDTDTNLSLSERKMLKDVICVSNGMLIISDNLSRVSEEKFEEIRQCVAFSKELNGGKVYPLGVMDTSHPTYLLNTAGALLALNFGDEYSVVPLDTDQLLRIFGYNGMKMPKSFTAETGEKFTLRELSQGLALQARSSIILRF
jgi:alpha-galactosidase